MYSLPITMFSNYWRATRDASVYVCGTAILSVGTVLMSNVIVPPPPSVIDDSEFRLPQWEAKKLSVDQRSDELVDSPIINATFEVVDQQAVYQFEGSQAVSQAKKKVILQNNNPFVGEPLDSAQFEVGQAMAVEATAYTYTGNLTATGVYPREGLIAVDPKVIPLGSYLYVEGYGYAIAADTGGAIIGNKIDVFFPSWQECIDWGRRQTQIFPLTPK